MAHVCTEVRYCAVLPGLRFLNSLDETSVSPSQGCQNSSCLNASDKVGVVIQSVYKTPAHMLGLASAALAFSITSKTQCNCKALHRKGLPQDAAACKALHHWQSRVEFRVFWPGRLLWPSFGHKYSNPLALKCTNEHTNECLRIWQC